MVLVSVNQALFSTMRVREYQREIPPLVVYQLFTIDVSPGRLGIRTVIVFLIALLLAPGYVPTSIFLSWGEGSGEAEECSG